MTLINTLNPRATQQSDRLAPSDADADLTRALTHRICHYTIRCMESGTQRVRFRWPARRERRNSAVAAYPADEHPAAQGELLVRAVRNTIQAISIGAASNRSAVRTIVSLPSKEVHMPGYARQLKLIRNFVFTLLVVAAVALPSSLMAWPPWLSIETPVNPYNPATHGAFLLARVSTRSGSTDMVTLMGSAEGLVAGKRTSIHLSFDSTPTAGVFALRKQWPSTGTWTLVISLGPSSGAATTAIVDLGANGEVVSVRVPTRRNAHSDVVPRAVSRAEIDSSLAARAGVRLAATAVGNSI